MLAKSPRIRQKSTTRRSLPHRKSTQQRRMKSPKLHTRTQLSKSTLASPLPNQRCHLSTTVQRELPPPIPDITPESSFFQRGVKALFEISDLREKIGLITESRRLLRKNAIPLINWPRDEDIYNYFHFGTVSPTTNYPSLSTFHSIKPPSRPQCNRRSAAGVGKKPTTNQQHLKTAEKLNLDAVEAHLWGDLVKTTSNAWVMPARPSLPNLQYRVPSHKDLNVPMNAYILHTLAHIELNAVEMYLDTVLRFGIFPPNRDNHQTRAEVLDADKPAIPHHFPRLTPSPLATHPTVNDPTQSSHRPIIDPIFSEHYKERTLIPRIQQQRPHPSLQYIDPRYPIYDDGYNITHPNFIDDLLSIVSDESRHFLQCCDRLAELSSELNRDLRYGTQPSTFQLWVLGANTRTDIAERLAVIPLSQEARGLDSTTRFVDKLYSLNDKKSAGIVFLIGKEEERHVSLGTKWFVYTSAARGIISPGFAAEYDYNKFPMLDLEPAEKWDFRGFAKNNQPIPLKKKTESQRNHSKNFPSKINLDELEFDASGYHTDSEHVIKARHGNKNDPFNWLVEDSIENQQTEIQSNRADQSPPPDSTPSSTNLSTALQTKPYFPQIPIHVKQVSSEIRTTESERLLCESNIAKYWQDNVRDHFDDGFFPPFNRIARYASGMPESWYLPVATTFFPLNFVTVPPNAPFDAPIRKHFKRLIDKMNFDHGKIDINDGANQS